MEYSERQHKLWGFLRVLGVVNFIFFCWWSIFYSLSIIFHIHSYMSLVSLVCILWMWLPWTCCVSSSFGVVCFGTLTRNEAVTLVPKVKKPELNVWGTTDGFPTQEQSALSSCYFSFSYENTQQKQLKEAKAYLAHSLHASIMVSGGWGSWSHCRK